MAERADRATKVQFEERVEACMLMLSRSLRTGQIKKLMAEKFGINGAYAAKHYIPRARERLLANLRRSQDEIKCESLAFYESIIADPKARTNDKIQARKLIDRLLGLQSPMRLEHTGADGGPIKTQNVHEAMARVMTDPQAHEAASQLGKRLNGSLTPTSDPSQN